MKDKIIEFCKVQFSSLKLPDAYWDEFANYLLLLFPPSFISEEEIKKMANEYADKHGAGLWGDYYRAYLNGFKAAITELK